MRIILQETSKNSSLCLRKTNYNAINIVLFFHIQVSLITIIFCKV